MMSDYNWILGKALADGLSESFADLHKIKYRGIRHAPGYPSQPNWTEQKKIFKWLNIEKEIGIKLTENYAMFANALVYWFLVYIYIIHKVNIFN